MSMYISVKTKVVRSLPFPIHTLVMPELPCSMGIKGRIPTDINAAYCNVKPEIRDTAVYETVPELSLATCKYTVF